jgi:hypothetical protein
MSSGYVKSNANTAPPLPASACPNGESRFAGVRAGMSRRKRRFLSYNLVAKKKKKKIERRRRRSYMKRACQLVNIGACETSEVHIRSSSDPMKIQTSSFKFQICFSFTWLICLIVVVSSARKRAEKLLLTEVK